MLKVTEALYMREFQKVRGILEEETTLRQKLAQLDTQIADNQTAIRNDHTMKTVGVDMLWQGWVTRTRRNLNTELAQVMARKLVAMDGVRQAFGRRQAVEKLLDLDKADNKRSLDNQIHASVTEMF